MSTSGAEHGMRDERAATILAALVDVGGEPIAVYQQSVEAQALWQEVGRRLTHVRYQAVARLHAELDSPFDVAAALGISHQRVQQMVAAAQRPQHGLALVLYRSATRPAGTPASGSERTDGGEWLRVSAEKRPQLQVVVEVVDGTVARIRAVQPDGDWSTNGVNDSVRVPLGAPLTPEDAAARFPTLPLRLGASRPHRRGRSREYLAF